jgi:hypothetical protein
MKRPRMANLLLAIRDDCAGRGIRLIALPVPLL